MKPSTHPLTNQPVILKDGRKGLALSIFSACTNAPERAMVRVGEAWPVIVPVAELRAEGGR